MSTVLPNKEKQLEDSSSNYPAPKKILKNTYELVLGAVHSGKKLILITGEEKKGKTSLIHTISKDLSTKNRIVNLSGKDLPNLDPSNSKNDSELNLMKDFILESTDLEDKLVVTLDDADCLPISFLGELIEHTKNPETKTHQLQLILTGPVSFKDQLLSVEQIDEEDLSHFSIDTLSEEQIGKIAKEKTYKISSNIKNIMFKPGALHTMSEFIQNDRQLLDVVLEWCAALVKKDQLSSVTSNTISRAAGFARKFSKDKNLRLSNSYPPSHEVYKYINEIESVKNTKRASTEKNRNKVKKNKAFIETKSKTTKKQEALIPTITTKVDKTKVVNQTIEEEIVLENFHDIEEEVAPIQRVPATKHIPKVNKESFPALAGLIGLLLLGFITFIGFRIGSDPVTETPVVESPATESVEKKIVVDEPSSSEQVALAEPQEKVVEKLTEQNQTKPVNTPTKTVNTDNPVKKIPVASNENTPASKPQKSIVASDVKDSTPAVKKTDKQATPTVANVDVTTKDVKETELSKDNKLENIAAAKTQKNTSESPKLSPEAEIKNLLSLADYQFENKQLSTPVGDNALETYRKVLTKYPNNKAAAAGINKVRDKYISWGKFYSQQNDTKRAKRFFNKALEIEPKNAVALANLQNINQQESKQVGEPNNTLALQDSTPTNKIEKLMVSATQKMQEIDNDIKENKRNYRIYQEAQTAYQTVLRSQPQNQDAIQGLSRLRNYYSEWAELQIKSQNYNIALFLYGQALSIEPKNTQIAQRIEQIREMKQQAL